MAEEKVKRKIQWKKVLGTLLSVFMLASVLAAFAFASASEEELKCQDVSIKILPEEIHFYKRKTILDLVKRGARKDQDLKGIPIRKINTSRLEQVIEKQNWTEDAQVYSDLKGNLHIRVYQRQPIFRVITGDGEQYYVDQNRIKFPISDKFTARVPVATGAITESLRTGDSLYSFVGNQLFSLLSYVDNDAFLKALTAQIFVRADNELVLVPEIGDHLILIGDANNLEDKFARLKAFYREGLNRLGWNAYKSIDLRFKNQVIATKKKNTHV